MKYKLLVSTDCGINYHKRAESENLDELLEQANKLEWERWVIEDENDDFADVSPMHKHIVNLMTKLNQ